jgi:hypothetical protein
MNESETPLQFVEDVGIQKVSNRQHDDSVKFVGTFTLEWLKDGQVVHTEVFKNTVVNEGKNKVLDVMFNAVTQITTWYAGLIDSAGFSSNPVTDTMSSHAGWVEYTAYTEANRQAWGVGSAASQQITNASPAVFNMNASGNVRGIFIASNNTKGGTTGTLWSTVLFSASLPVANTDQLKITYTLAVA